MLSPKLPLEQPGIAELSALFQKKALSPVEYTAFVLEQAQRYQELNLFITMMAEQAMEQARAAENRYLKGEPKSPLDGIPLAIKDMIGVQGVPTTQGCSFYKDDIAPEDAFVIKVLREMGVVFPGKANTSQFALGPMGDVSHIGPCRNPHDPKRVTGGSSSGSAASVAALAVPGALGTDTGGSIRMPAALCGVVGMKPTFSLVSNAGVKPLSHVLDTIGPLTRNVRDNALLLNAIAKHNPLDWRNADRAPEDYLVGLGKGLSGKTILTYESWNQEDVQPEVAQAMKDGLDILKQAGANVIPVTPPDLSEIRKAHQLVMCAGGHAAHQQDVLRNNGDVFDQVMQRLLSGDTTSDHYITCLEERPHLIRLLLDLFGAADAFLLPSTPITANRILDQEVTFSGKSYVPITTHPRFTWIANFSGFPAISLPAGKDQLGLPIGLSLIGKPFQEATLYQLSACLEDAFSSSGQ